MSLKIKTTSNEVYKIPSIKKYLSPLLKDTTVETKPSSNFLLSIFNSIKANLNNYLLAFFSVCLVLSLQSFYISTNTAPYRYFFKKVINENQNRNQKQSISALEDVKRKIEQADLISKRITTIFSLIFVLISPIIFKRKAFFRVLTTSIFLTYSLSYLYNYYLLTFSKSQEQIDGKLSFSEVDSSEDSSEDIQFKNTVVEEKKEEVKIEKKEEVVKKVEEDEDLDSSIKEEGDIFIIKKDQESIINIGKEDLMPSSNIIDNNKIETENLFPLKPGDNLSENYASDISLANIALNHYFFTDLFYEVSAVFCIAVLYQGIVRKLELPVEVSLATSLSYNLLLWSLTYSFRIIRERTISTKGTVSEKEIFEVGSSLKHSKTYLKSLFKNKWPLLVSIVVPILLLSIEFKNDISKRSLKKDTILKNIIDNIYNPFKQIITSCKIVLVLAFLISLLRLVDVEIIKYTNENKTTPIDEQINSEIVDQDVIDQESMNSVLTKNYYFDPGTNKMVFDKFPNLALQELHKKLSLSLIIQHKIEENTKLKEVQDSFAGFLINIVPFLILYLFKKIPNERILKNQRKILFIFACTIRIIAGTYYNKFESNNNDKKLIYKGVIRTIPTEATKEFLSFGFIDLFGEKRVYDVAMEVLILPFVKIISPIIVKTYLESKKITELEPVTKITELEPVTISPITTIKQECPFKTTIKQECPFKKALSEGDYFESVESYYPESYYPESEEKDKNEYNSNSEKNNKDHELNEGTIEDNMFNPEESHKGSVSGINFDEFKSDNLNIMKNQINFDELKLGETIIEETSINPMENQYGIFEEEDNYEYLEGIIIKKKRSPSFVIENLYNIENLDNAKKITTIHKNNTLFENFNKKEISILAIRRILLLIKTSLMILSTIPLYGMQNKLDLEKRRKFEKKIENSN